MHIFFRKFFLVIVSTSIFQVYSMENEGNILSKIDQKEADKKLIEILHSIKNNHSEENWKNFKDAITQGADVDIVLPDGFNAFISASFHGNIDIINFLLERKANINVSNQDGVTPLHAAVAFPNTNRTDIVTKLLENEQIPMQQLPEKIPL